MKKNRHPLIQALFSTTVLVAALGYFVDIYDLILFGIVRVQSLKDLGVAGDELIKNGVLLLNMQMAGMLIGGIIWGILGDKKGRLSVLFGSIILYSAANFFNAFVGSITMYAVLRFIAGVGLAGELGAAITLVSEVMSKESRGYGTALVATIGVSGAIFAAIVGELFSWQTAYIIGGVLGFLLLLTRVKMFESGMFKNLEQKGVGRGKFLALFTSHDRFKRYINCVLIGMPIWFVVGVLITFSPEFARTLGYTGPVVAGRSILFTYAGLIFGDFLSGFLSQLLQSRKKVVAYAIVVTALLVALFLYFPGNTAFHFYAFCVLLGLAIGYWAVFVTVASEQFGTNLRATVTTTAPNFVRGAVVPITFGFEALRGSVGMVYAASIIGTICIVIALAAVYSLKETFGKDLNFLENI
ncbi:MAG: MFS transporter [Ignavibacteriales bacterium]|nr:MFS transporter [Ignavibacteriales bacterium]